MNGFERASLALVYHVYYMHKVHSTGKSIENKSFLVETYDDGDNLRKSRYFAIRRISTETIEIYLDEGGRHLVKNTAPIIKHGTVLFSEEKSRQIEIDALDSSYVTGKGDGYRFIMQEYGPTTIRVEDDQYKGSVFKYKILPK